MMRGGLVIKTWKHSAFTCAVPGKVMNASLSLAQDTGRLLGLATLMFSVVLIGTGKAWAQPQPKPKVLSGTVGRVSRPPAQQRETWRKSMVRSQRPKKGCFVATYPETKWREAQCTTAPNRPYRPRRGLRPQIVGNGVDFSAQVTGNTSIAEGSFDRVTGVTSETGAGTANQYSLQLNTEFFTTSACSGAANPAACQGWEQFIFSNPGGGSSGAVFIQYWMINYATTCPAGWNTFGSDCWINSTNATAVPAQTIASLPSQQLTGNVGDSVSVAIMGTLYSATGDNRFPDLTSGWHISEFNIFGDGNASEANFNAGSTIVVRTSVNSGSPAAPSCQEEGFTAETNNLNLVSTPAVGPLWPSIVFTESNDNSTPASCATAASDGDTHLKTFNGLFYDFQASGDFLLASAGPDFVVQTRQASGAPTWPNASLNKAVATQMGKTRVALYVEPARLLIDGRPNDLPDGKALELPGGVQVSREGNRYAITDEKGNSVRGELNSSYINVTVGLGHTPQPQARGLLGNPSGNVNQLVTSTGVVLKEPVAFNDLYHSYADSWRVQPNQSLFTEATTIKAGIPNSLFFASHLSPQEYQRARAICQAAHVTTKTFLDACTLDTAVLNDEAAAKVFVNRPAPRHVVTPVLRVNPRLNQ